MGIFYHMGQDSSFFTNAVHEAIENNVSTPNNHVTADEVPVAVSYVFFRHRMAGKGTGNRRLICAKEPACIVATK
ncbi:unknown [Firmicutes bacterium CAG:791]|nr:unknown [Firmicutes bacterium CAG:791]